MVRQGEVYWYDFGNPEGSEPAYIRPVVVVQNDGLNDTRIKTTVVCAITSETKRQNMFGFVYLPKGAANLSKPSLVILTQVHTVNKDELENFIGTLDEGTIQKITSKLCEITRPMTFEEMAIWSQQ